MKIHRCKIKHEKHISSIFNHIEAFSPQSFWLNKKASMPIPFWLKLWFFNFFFKPSISTNFSPPHLAFFNWRHWPLFSNQKHSKALQLSFTAEDNNLNMNEVIFKAQLPMVSRMFLWKLYPLKICKTPKNHGQHLLLKLARLALLKFAFTCVALGFHSLQI